MADPGPGAAARAEATRRPEDEPHHAPDRQGAGPQGGARIARARQLPGGRAVVGALLVTLAAVGVFVAYLSATAAPTARYLVATEALEPGTHLGTTDDIRDVFGASALELTPVLAARAVPVDEVEALVGTALLAPLERGDLLTRTHLGAREASDDAHSVSFPIRRADAVAGALQAGQHVDVVATYGSGDGAYTAFVVRAASLVAVSGSDGGALGSGDELTLTLAVVSVDEVLALGHAVNTADVIVTRTAAGTGPAGPQPLVHRPTPPAPSGGGA